MKAAEDAGVMLPDLPLETLAAIDARIDGRVYDVLSVEASVASRKSHGGTEPVQVRARIAEAKQQWEKRRCSLAGLWSRCLRRRLQDVAQSAACNRPRSEEHTSE